MTKENCLYIYIYVNTHTYTRTPTCTRRFIIQEKEQEGSRDWWRLLLIKLALVPAERDVYLKLDGVINMHHHAQKYSWNIIFLFALKG